MKTITPKATLFWYDGPQVFEARDAIGGHYVGVAVEEPPGVSRHVVVGLPPAELHRLQAGALDLRACLVEAGAEEWHLTPVDVDLAEPLRLDPQAGSLEATGLLPDEGFFLHLDSPDESTLVESRTRNRLVMELAAEPPEAASEHRIRLDTYLEILGEVQTLVRHAYRSAWRKLSKDYRGMLDQDTGPMLDVVVPASGGSFRVLLEATQAPNLIGESELARALRRVDALFEEVGEPDRALATVREHRGHFAGSYLRLLQVLAERETSLRYSWAEPSAAGASHRSVTSAEADRLVQVLSEVSNLSTESVELVGDFEKFNRATGLWGLLTEAGKEQGKIRDGGPSLDGLEVGARYRFSCVEEIERTEGTGRERRTLYLESHDPV